MPVSIAFATVTHIPSRCRLQLHVLKCLPLLCVPAVLTLIVHTPLFLQVTACALELYNEDLLDLSVRSGKEEVRGPFPQLYLQVLHAACRPNTLVPVMQAWQDSLHPNN